MAPAACSSETVFSTLDAVANASAAPVTPVRVAVMGSKSLRSRLGLSPSADATSCWAATGSPLVEAATCWMRVVNGVTAVEPAGASMVPVKARFVAMSKPPCRTSGAPFAAMA